MTSLLLFQRQLQTRPARFANYYNQYGKPSQKNPQPVRPDWLVVLTFVVITLMVVFG
ncbi:hypothetical protein GCM10027347_40050 [Larkinella harenae]